MSRALAVFVFVVLVGAGCGAGWKHVRGMYDRDDPEEGPGDALVGPLGDTSSPGMNTPSRRPSPRR
jgi:hypothetical protein